jgi:GrpB-like predicted nucleotidyltransferase (UPF0157 family)
MNKMRKVEVIKYDENWCNQYKVEAVKLEKLFEDIFKESYHIGSTSVPGIYSKPIIDILIVVSDIDAVDNYNHQMKERGYIPKGSFGIAGRRFFQKGAEQRTHHVHIYQKEDENIMRHLAFKEYLINHPQIAKEYSDLKIQLSQKYPYDIERYMEGKNDFIKRIEKKALEDYHG